MKGSSVLSLPPQLVSPSEALKVLSIITFSIKTFSIIQSAQRAYM
jgi:hypothetical protein